MEKAIQRYWPVFVLPTLLAFIIGFIWPFIWGVALSFCKFTTVQNVTFVGLGNYAKIWLDDTFTHAFWFTAVFTVVSTVLINVLAFGIALLLTRGIRGTLVVVLLYELGIVTMVTLFGQAERALQYQVVMMAMVASIRRAVGRLRPTRQGAGFLLAQPISSRTRPKRRALACITIRCAPTA